MRVTSACDSPSIECPETETTWLPSGTFFTAAGEPGCAAYTRSPPVVSCNATPSGPGPNEKSLYSICPTFSTRSQRERRLRRQDKARREKEVLLFCAVDGRAIWIDVALWLRRARGAARAGGRNHLHHSSAIGFVHMRSSLTIALLLLGGVASRSPSSPRLNHGLGNRLNGAGAYRLKDRGMEDLPWWQSASQMNDLSRQWRPSSSVRRAPTRGHLARMPDLLQDEDAGPDYGDGSYGRALGSVLVYDDEGHVCAVLLND